MTSSDASSPDSFDCVGLVNPGAMGSSIGAQLTRAGSRVVWAGEGRSTESHLRAGDAGLVDVESMQALVDEADLIISVCPPAAAVATASTIADLGFAGVYLDANAVSPATGRSVAALFNGSSTESGAIAIDGGIVGPPVSGPGSTRLYISGDAVAMGSIENLFESSNLEVRVVDGPAGAASAVKMCFAAWTKGTTALLLDICALADAEGVTDSLRGEWATSMPELSARADRSPAMVGAKAWRFEGEMHEIAASFAAHDLPDGFHLAAAEVYARLAELKGSRDTSLDEVVDLLSARV